MIPAAALPDFVVIEYADVLWAGFLMTIKISAIGIVGSLFVGLVGAAIGELRIPVLRQAVRVYVEAIRNTPLLVQVFTLFFVHWASRSAHSSSDASPWWHGAVPTTSRTFARGSAQCRTGIWKALGRWAFRARERFSTSLCQSARGYLYPG